MANVTMKQDDIAQQTNADDITDNATTGAAPLTDVLKSDISLEEKLAAIEEAMKNAQAQANEEAAKNGTVAAPVDPADLTMCEGCQ